VFIKYARELPPKEKRLYRIIGAASGLIWLGSVYFAMRNNYEGAAFYLGVLAGIGSATFGLASQNSIHIWPFYPFFEQADDA
jgi:hypothetical protein